MGIKVGQRCVINLYVFYEFQGVLKRFKRLNIKMVVNRIYNLNIVYIYNGMLLLNVQLYNKNIYIFIRYNI